MDKNKIIMIVVALLLAIGVWYFFFRGGGDEMAQYDNDKAGCEEAKGFWTATPDDEGTTDKDESDGDKAGTCTTPAKDKEEDK